MIPNQNIPPIADLKFPTSTITVDKNGALVGKESILNFIEGAGITLTILDNPALSIVSIQIDATGAGSVPTSRTLTIGGTAADIIVTPSTPQDLTVNRSWVIDLINTAVTPATYGSATQVGSFTVDAKGRLTAASNITVTPAASSITGGQALTKVDDTNVTLTLGGSPSTALLVTTSLTLGWTGTLASGRLNSNVVQSVVNDTNVTGSIVAQVLTLGWTGTLAAGRLNSNVVQAVSNDTNITGSIALQTLTFAWSGTLADSRLSTTTVAAGSYGSATQVGTFTVGATGRLTAASNVTITPAAGSITGAQNLSVGTSLQITAGTGIGATLQAVTVNAIQDIRTTATTVQFTNLGLGTTSSGSYPLFIKGTHAIQIQDAVPTFTSWLEQSSTTTSLFNNAGAINIYANSNGGYTTGLYLTTANHLGVRTTDFSDGSTVRIKLGTTTHGNLGLLGGSSSVTFQSTDDAFNVFEDISFKAGSNIIFGVDTGFAYERMRITGTGVVVGTTVPRALLDVTSGAANINGGSANGINITAPNVTLASQNVNLSINTNDAQGADIGGSIGLGGLYRSGQRDNVPWGLIKGGKNNSTDGDYGGYMAFGTYNYPAGMTEWMRISHIGTVGIRTQPSVNYGLLVLAANTTYNIGIEAVANNGVHAIYLRPNSDNAAHQNLISSNFESGAAYLPLCLSGRENVADFCLKAGNTGVGTTSPACKVDVLGTIRSTSENDPATGIGIEMFYDGVQGVIATWDRGGATVQPLTISASTFTVNSGFVVGSTGTVTKVHSISTVGAFGVGTAFYQSSLSASTSNGATTNITGTAGRYLISYSIVTRATGTAGSTASVTFQWTATSLFSATRPTATINLAHNASFSDGHDEGCFLVDHEPGGGATQLKWITAFSSAGGSPTYDFVIFVQVLDQ